jgi:hypothetical protein
MHQHEALAAFPPIVRRVMESASPELLVQRPAAGGFSLIENAWHLADLEVEGYSMRLSRLLSEAAPSFADFDGETIARERDYLHLPLAPALEKFERARAANVARIAAATRGDLQRSGDQEGVGTVTFERVIAMMGDHDASHAVELTDLCRELGIEPPAELAEWAHVPFERTA